MKITTFAKQSPMSFLLIIGIVGYFILQFLLGVNIDKPSGQDLLKFGANFLPKTINEPFRLLTAGFVHIGIMHLLFNAFALYYLSPIGEKILGKWLLLSLFLISVLGGNLLSFCYELYNLLNNTTMPTINAGASGGIMGINAFLLVIALSPKYRPYLNAKGLFFMLAINLIIGFAISGINNAGHIGGAILGAIFGIIIGFLPRHRHWLIGGLWAVLVVIFVVVRQLTNQPL